MQAREWLADYKAYKREHDVSNSSWEEQWWERWSDSRHSGLVIIVFASLCLEALINRYGAVSTSDTYFKNYLDKLETVPKWVIIPKLITGDAISSDSQAFEALKKLYRYRNKVVHFKSYLVEDNEEGQVAFEQKVEEFHSAVENAIRALFQVPVALAQLDPDFFGEYNWYSLEEEENEEFREYA